MMSCKKFSGQKFLREGTVISQRNYDNMRMVDEQDQLIGRNK